MKHRHLVRMLALGLSAALVLCACDGGNPDKTNASASPSPSASASEPPEETGVDYSKYNAYLKLSNEMSDVLDVLDIYFSHVEFAEEFALMEGGDYGAMKDGVQFFIANTYPVKQALEYVSKEPSYPAVDAAVRAMGDSPVKLMEAVDDLASYLRFNAFEEDNMAKAAEIHAALWEPMQIFGTYYGEFLSCMSDLADQVRDEDLEIMRENGELILYYSSLMIYASQDILNNIWDQIDAANTDPETEFVLPEIDRTQLAPLFGELMESYDSLTEAMGKEEEQKKVFSGATAENAMKLYTTKVNNLYVAMGNLADALNQNSDYAEVYDKATDALNGMIDGYNSII